MTKPIKTLLLDAVETVLLGISSVKQWKKGEGIPIDQDMAVYPWGCFFDQPVSRTDNNRMVNVTIDLVIHVVVVGQWSDMFDLMDQIDADIETALLNDSGVQQYSTKRIKPAPCDKLYIDEEKALMQVTYQLTYTHAWKDPYSQ